VPIENGLKLSDGGWRSKTWSAGLSLWGGRWKGADFHGLNQSVRKGESMAYVLIGKNCSSQVAHDLMHIDQNASGLLRVKGNRLDVWIDLAPLLCPVSANFFRPTDKTAFEGFWPSHVWSHESKGSVNVSHVEGRVRRTEQVDFWCRSIWHKIYGGDAAVSEY
jgi:hypothetical protein